MWMPVLANPRHERFAQELFRGLAEGLTRGECYSASGYTKNPNAAKVNACRLLKAGGHIVARVQELQREAAKAKKATVDTIVDELESAREIARENKQPSAMVAASTAKAKILGLEINRTEVGKPGDFTGVDSMEELAESLLSQANPRLHVTRDMVKAAIHELHRH